jgi:hypothetical protein
MHLNQPAKQRLARCILRSERIGENGRRQKQSIAGLPAFGRPLRRDWTPFVLSNWPLSTRFSEVQRHAPLQIRQIAGVARAAVGLE